MKKSEKKGFKRDSEKLIKELYVDGADPGLTHEEENDIKIVRDNPFHRNFRFEDDMSITMNGKNYSQEIVNKIFNGNYDRTRLIMLSKLLRKPQMRNLSSFLLSEILLNKDIFGYISQYLSNQKLYIPPPHINSNKTTRRANSLDVTPRLLRMREAEEREAPIQSPVQQSSVKTRCMRGNCTI